MRMPPTRTHLQHIGNYPELYKHKTYLQTELSDAEVMRDYFGKNKFVDVSPFAPIGNLTKE